MSAAPAPPNEGELVGPATGHEVIFVGPRDLEPVFGPMDLTFAENYIQYRQSAQKRIYIFLKDLQYVKATPALYAQRLPPFVEYLQLYCKHHFGSMIPNADMENIISHFTSQQNHDSDFLSFTKMFQEMMSLAGSYLAIQNAAAVATLRAEVAALRTQLQEEVTARKRDYEAFRDDLEEKNGATNKDLSDLALAHLVPSPIPQDLTRDLERIRDLYEG